MERKEQDEDRNGNDAADIEGRPRLARRHYDELFVPQRLVGADWQLQDYFLAGEEVERQ